MMTFQTATGLLMFSAMYGRRSRTAGGRDRSPLDKRLTLWSEAEQCHFLSDLPVDEPTAPEFLDRLEAVFSSARGGWLVVRVPLRVGPDQVFVFTISSGRATRVPDKEVVVMLGRVTATEFYRVKKWKSHDFRTERREREVVSA
jgi:hypothetical protein